MDNKFSGPIYESPVNIFVFTPDFCEISVETFIERSGSGIVPGKSSHEQVLFYLYDLRNTPENGVGPDPRLGRKTYHCLTPKGTAQVEKKEEKSLNIGFDFSMFGVGYKKTETKNPRRE